MDLENFNKARNFCADEPDYFGRPLRESQDIKTIYPVMWFTHDYFISLCKQTYPDRQVFSRILHITSGRHTENSAHPRGFAIDEVIVGLTFLEAALLALGTRMNHGPSGFGFYPFSRPPFVHYDFKDWDRDVNRCLLWYRDVEGDYINNARDPELVTRKLHEWEGIPMRGR